MANEATATDQYVRREIEKFGVRYEEQGSSHPEIAKALKGASKQGKSGIGKPEFVMQISDYLIVIEDKRDNDKLINLTEDGSIAKDIPSLSGFAVNGAVHYANHIVTKTSSFDEVIAIGITGDEEFHSIQPVLVSITEEGITEEKLPKLTDLQELHPNNINEWYSVNVLKEYSIEQKRIFELQNVSKELHEDLRNYASLEGENKATVISAILLALNEEDFDIKKLTGNKYPKKTDGKKDTTRPVIDNDGMRILKAVKDYIASEGVMPEDKVNTLLNKFAFLETNVLLNEKNDTLGVTPLHYFTKKLQDKVIHHFKQNTDYDILGNFYGEFVKYGGSDGNGLGIVLTPHHITTIMTELIEVLPTDYVLDPACGSGAFLISAMNRMTKLAKDRDEINRIKQHQLLGIELQEKMFTVATTNMILLGDEKIFTLHSTLNGIDKNKLVDDGERIFPYITRSKSNNGLDMFVSKQSSPINKGNVIIIGLDTQTVFYQEADFYTGQNVQILYNEYLNKNVAMFLIPIIKKQLEVLNWGGNGATLGRLKKKRVSLPITDFGFPDWNFMDEYVQIKLNKIKNSYQLPKQHVITDFRELDEVEWGEYLVSDYFDIIKSKIDHKTPLPYISAKKEFNGFKSLELSPKNFYPRNTISWNKIGDGGAGLAYFHPYDYSLDDINCISIKSKDELEKYCNLFIVRMLSQYFGVFNHGHTLSKRRFLRIKIMLPTKNKLPDFQFMEQYMKRMENRIIRKMEQ